MERILLVGAGIAGLTLAVLLDRDGWDVTLVEIAPELRSGGQIVDLRSGSAGVLERMGLLDAVAEKLIPQSGMAWVDGDGRHLAEMPVTAFGGRGFVSDAELARADLAAVLHAAGSPRIRFLFGDTVTGIADTPDGVVVALRSGASETFDLVVGADGAHSRVRALRFGEEEEYRHPLGVAHAWFSIAEPTGTPDLDGWFLLHNAPGSRVVGIRPGPRGTQEVGFSLPAAGLPDRRDREARMRFLTDGFAEVGWRAPELLAAARTADDFALDTGDQIRMPHWWSGRVVLLGDSAWCAAPLSGLGTALALKGAESLAAHLDGHRGDDHPAIAFAAFERDMRPVARTAQRLPPGRVRSFAPRTAWGIRAMTGSMRMLEGRAVQRVASAALSRFATG